MRATVGLALAAVVLSGCDTYHFLAGTWREDRRQPQRAIAHYEKFLAARPNDPRSCEVRLRAAEIYRSVFDRCGEARRHYEAAGRDFAHVPECHRRAKLGLMLCPDFFPVEPGRTWTYVDSASRGKAMRLDWKVTDSTGPARGTIRAALYAGAKKIKDDKETYVKEDWTIWRVTGKQREPVLKFPFRVGQTWSVKREKHVIDFLAVAQDAVVKSAAGTFKGCLKMRERSSEFPQVFRYDYYCPGVGRVKTTLGGPGFENPNTELLRFGKIR